MNESIDLPTIDVDVLRTLQDVSGPCSPIVPYVVPQQPVPDAVHSCCPVTDELIRSCVTPRKVPKVRDTLPGEKVRHRCAIKLLPYFFTKEELAMCNTDGSYEKTQLDRTRLHSLKGKFYEGIKYKYLRSVFTGDFFFVMNRFSDIATTPCIKLQCDKN